MALTFLHPEFEKEVCERLNIYDRDITEEDASLLSERDQYYPLGSHLCPHLAHRFTVFPLPINPQTIE